LARLMYDCIHNYDYFRFCFNSYDDSRYLLSFPTRRSSDLTPASALRRCTACCWMPTRRMYCAFWRVGLPPMPARMQPLPCFPARSEEHTSELQSRFDLVCRPLLEKKTLYFLRISYTSTYTV